MPPDTTNGISAPPFDLNDPSAVAGFMLDSNNGPDPLGSLPAPQLNELMANLKNEGFSTSLKASLMQRAAGGLLGQDTNSPLNPASVTTPSDPEGALGAAADFLMPGATDVLKGSGLPVAYSAGAIPTMALTKSPALSRGVGVMTAYAANLAMNQAAPVIDNWWHSNVANPFDKPQKEAAGPLKAEDVVGAAIETPLQLGLMALSRWAQPASNRLKNAAGGKLRKLLAHYEKGLKGSVDEETRQIVSDLDAAFAHALSLGAFDPQAGDSILAGDGRVIARSWLAVNGENGLRQKFSDEVSSIIQDSGKALTPADVQGVLQGVYSRILKTLSSDEFRKQSGGASIEMRDAAYDALHSLEKHIAYLNDPKAVASDGLLNRSPLEWLQSIKQSFQQLTDYSEGPDKGVRLHKNKVLMKIATFTKEGIENLVDTVFAGTGRQGELKKANTSLSEMIVVGDFLQGALDKFVTGGPVKRTPSLPNIAAGAGSLAALPAAMGQYPQALGIAATTVPVWATLKFTGNASNQVRMSQLLNRTSAVLEGIAKATGTGGEFIVFPRSITELKKVAPNLRRQLVMMGVDAESVRMVDEILSIPQADVAARGLSKFIQESPAGPYLDAMIEATNSGWKSLFDGKLNDPAEIIAANERMVEENETPAGYFLSDDALLSNTKKMRDLNATGKIVIEPLVSTEPEPVELSPTIEQPQESALGKLAENISSY